MFGGSLSTPRIQLKEAAMFTQTNGAVNVANELFLDDNGGLFSYNEQVTSVLRIDLTIPSHGSRSIRGAERQLLEDLLL